MATVQTRKVGGRPAKKVPTAYGRRLERMFAEAGLTRTEVADRLGIRYVSLWAWLHTPSRPNRDHTFKLAKILRRPAEDLQ